MKSILKKTTVLLSMMMVALALAGCAPKTEPAVATDVPAVEAPVAEAPVVEEAPTSEVAPVNP